MRAFMQRIGFLRTIRTMVALIVRRRLALLLPTSTTARVASLQIRLTATLFRVSWRVHDNRLLQMRTLVTSQNTYDWYFFHSSLLLEVGALIGKYEYSLSRAICHLLFLNTPYIFDRLRQKRPTQRLLYTVFREAVHALSQYIIRTAL